MFIPGLTLQEDSGEEVFSCNPFDKNTNSSYPHEHKVKQNMKGGENSYLSLLSYLAEHYKTRYQANVLAQIDTKLLV